MQPSRSHDLCWSVRNRKRVDAINIRLMSTKPQLAGAGAARVAVPNRVGVVPNRRPS